MLGQGLMIDHSLKKLVSTITLVIYLLLNSSCVQEANTGRKNTRSGVASNGTATGPTANTNTAPNFSTQSNYFQKGSTQVTGQLTIAADFTDTFYLRGKEVHNYIKGGNSNSAKCVVFHFKDSLNKQVLILSGKPQSFFNFQTNQEEYFYLLSPSDKNGNASFCQTAGVMSKVSTLFSSSPPPASAFSIKDVCPSCLPGILSSTATTILEASGAPLTNLSINYLGLKISNIVNNNPVVGGSCSESNECKQKGYDCCSSGICIKDGGIKPGVDTSSVEYLQSKSEISSNPMAILNYPQFYYLCTQAVFPTPTPTAVPNPEISSKDRLQLLKELYDCTTPYDGEAAICTSTYTDASTSPTYRRFQTGVDDRNFNDTYTGTASATLTQHSIYEITHAGETLFSVGSSASTAVYRINGTNPNTSGFLPPNSFYSGTGVAGVGNDTLTDPIDIFFNHTKAASAPNDTLKIRYKVDGSCQYINAALAKCSKVYVQGQNLGQVDDHYPASNEFKLPTYADTGKVIQVFVDDALINSDSSSMPWSMISGSPNKIKFTGSSLVVYDTQTIVLTFYVNLSTYPNVMKSKLEALNTIDDICNCGGPYCSLKPVYLEDSNGNTSIVDYKCVYPPPNVGPTPLQQVVYLSSKTVPLPYYDTTGVFQSQIDADTPVQEGTEFKYTNDDQLKPNNISSYIGFNEIYGSLTNKATSAKGARRVKVTSGKTYDIFVDTGGFSSCSNCGTDYFSPLTKLFPVNFASKGGGFTPDYGTTDPFKTTTYRAHDMIFGRACFVPATMIPWTHLKTSNRQNQRLGRHIAQHFLFANGYHRDWYGFDYGSVIGSFDGVRWFAVGNGRRIKAKTNYIYLAVNAYFGDLTNDTNYTVVVTDASTAPASGATSVTDYDNDGAQCQLFHSCDTDTDCITRLGWEYMCSDVNSISTKWPDFDINGLEIPTAELSSQKLVDLFSPMSGGSKRCVYRGRGAPCVADLSSTSTTFNDIDISDSNNAPARKPLACAPNYYCQNFQSGGSDLSKFNTKISRFAKSPSTQNAYNAGGVSDGDLVGKTARIIGEPYKYIGDSTLPTGALAQFNNNLVKGICLPGRDTTKTKINDAHSSNLASTSGYMGDVINGIGMTRDDVTNATTIYDYYYCPVINPVSGNYLMFEDMSNITGVAAFDGKYTSLAAAQNLSTNLLNIFNQNEMLGNSAEDSLTANYISSQVTSFKFENNRCLRSPGAVCHTDLDCAPSKKIADRINNIDPTDTAIIGLNKLLNRYEIEFWQQGLICHQAREKTDPLYDMSDNRCCRETGKEITTGTAFRKSNFSSSSKDLATGEPMSSGGGADTNEYPQILYNSVPNYGTKPSDPNRYSRWSTAFYEIKKNKSSLGTDFGGTSPAESDLYAFSPLLAHHDLGYGCLKASKANCKNKDDYPMIAQAKTLDRINTNTCCSGHWIRHFHDDNGGGHVWDSDKLQKQIPYTEFKCVNWDQCTKTTDGLTNTCGDGKKWDDSAADPSAAWTCAHTEFPSDPNCKIRNILIDEARPFMDFWRRFDLFGIPQIVIPALYSITGLTSTSIENYVRCSVKPSDQTAVPAATDYDDLNFNGKVYKAGVISTFEYYFDMPSTETPETGTTMAYSTLDKDNFATDQYKQIFSKDKFSCCKPAGKYLDQGEDASRCCTGYASDTKRCSLRANYTNVSVYFNKFVSSAARDLDPSYFDQETGWIKDTNIVAQLACTLKVCESGLLMRGVIYSRLKVPGHEAAAETYRTSRFLDDGSANGYDGMTDMFAAGPKWYDDLYCVPKAVADITNNPNIILFSCGATP